MNSKKKRSGYAMVITALLAIAIFSCDKKYKDPDHTVPEVITWEVTDITQTSAFVGGRVFAYVPEDKSGVCWNTSPSPTILNNVHYGGLGSGYINILYLLTPGTTYYLRAFAINDYGTGYGNEVVFSTVEVSPVTVTDIDGNVYHVVTIGTQDWLAENLNVTHYRNGESIPLITDSLEFINTTEGCCCNAWHFDSWGHVFGKHYNWAAIVDQRNIAPEGFHVPSFDEWITLIDYLGGYKVAGGKIKENGKTHWWCFDSNIGSTNGFGFSALPGGFRQYGPLYEHYMEGVFWSSSENIIDPSYVFHIGCDTTEIFFCTIDKKSACSIRCVRD
jgi:uncharacterized protein (TIGR02145 family)